MTLPNKKGWMAIAFILVSLAIPFAITYYVSTDAFKARYSRMQNLPPGNPVPQPAANLRTPGDQVMLIKGEPVQVENTRLVYKGIDKGQVLLDLYLLELDPAYPYPQSFPRENEDRLVRLGDISYTVASINNNALVLKINQVMGAQ